jgi:hypothetical protein
MVQNGTIYSNLQYWSAVCHENLPTYAREGTECIPEKSEYRGLQKGIGINC